ncbi:MAG: preprotein translocase subunit SecE [Mycobacteriales bacterium]
MTETRGSTAVTERVADRPTPATGGRGARGGGPLSRLSLFYRQVVAELRKVIWPTRRELITYTTVALIFVTVMVALVAGADLVFAKGVLAVFG